MPRSRSDIFLLIAPLFYFCNSLVIYFRFSQEKFLRCFDEQMIEIVIDDISSVRLATINLYRSVTNYSQMTKAEDIF
jgi:hypothetical protein